MTNKEYEKIETWFKEYSESYMDKGDEVQGALQLKLDHIFRVVAEMNMLLDSEDLPENDKFIGRSIALLHDVGRFEQLIRYKTFNDRKSYPHTKISLEEIEKNRVLDDIPSNEKEIILAAIDAHSRKSIPEDLDESSIYFSKLMRDSDKLDIWKVLIEADAEPPNATNNTVFFGLPDTEEYNPDFIKIIYAGQMADYANMRTRNDFRLLVIAWVFDLNFSASLKAVLDRGYIDRLADKLPHNTEIRETIDFVLKRLKDGVGRA